MINGPASAGPLSYQVIKIDGMHLHAYAVTMKADSITFGLRLAQLRALAEPTRLRLIRVLTKAELTVSELTVVTGLSQPSVSRHLKLLSETGLAERHQEGSWVFYRAVPSPLISALLAGLNGEEVGGDDARLDEVRAERRAVADRYFARHAGGWDTERGLQGGGERVEGAIREVAEGFAQSFGGRLPSVSDLGTGTARMLIVLDGLYERGVGFDVSLEMLSVARIKLEEANAERARLRRADLADLDETEAGASLVLLHHVLHFLSDPAVAVAKAVKLAANGQVMIADVAPHHDETLRENHAHRRLGFADDDIDRWAGEAGGRVLRVLNFPAADAHGLASKLWVLEGRREPTIARREEEHHAFN